MLLSQVHEEKVPLAPWMQATKVKVMRGLTLRTVDGTNYNCRTATLKQIHDIHKYQLRLYSQIIILVKIFHCSPNDNSLPSSLWKATIQKGVLSWSPCHCCQLSFGIWLILVFTITRHWCSGSSFQRGRETSSKTGTIFYFASLADYPNIYQKIRKASTFVNNHYYLIKQ